MLTRQNYAGAYYPGRGGVAGTIYWHIEALFEQDLDHLRADLAPSLHATPVPWLFYGVCFDWQQDPDHYLLADDGEGIARTSMYGLFVTPGH